MVLALGWRVPSSTPGSLIAKVFEQPTASAALTLRGHLSQSSLDAFVQPPPDLQIDSLEPSIWPLDRFFQLGQLTGPCNMNMIILVSVSALKGAI
ncbi:hypothetical protein BS17DRAFT_807687 [Gyrodon lividus]|nr:hypothetical protein BS17DRAFT_807687 [Gyrodon lividus]